MIVADTNLIAYLFIESDFTEAATKVLKQDPTWIAPVLWRSEFRNILALRMRKQLLYVDEAIKLMHAADSLMRGGEYVVKSSEVLRLSRSSGCSAYDCEFVALAQVFKVPLITADKQLLREFPLETENIQTFVSKNE